jgi:flavin-dependent dehydrogenase
VGGKSPTSGWKHSRAGRTEGARSLASPPVPPERYDVVIVGARCAGSPLGTLLARAGLNVAVVEQATFPRTTLSSHLMEADALTFLKRLGVLEPVKATGVRFMREVDTRLNDLRLIREFPLRPGDLGGASFLRRHLLDSILADAAAEAGAHMRMDTKVVGLIEDYGRVTGVRVTHDGHESELRAPLVVGADGRSSTVARETGARRYNVTPNERSYYFTFFEGADPSSDDLFVFHRWGDRMVWAGAADNGLYLVGVSAEMHEREAFKRDTERHLMEHMRSCEPTARALADARRATKIFGIVRFDGYFREPSGPGWVLVGDSGHFKDPSAGRGIGDAFIQVEALAPAIVAGLDGSGEPLDRAMARWGEWRNRKFEGHYWMATTLGCAGAIPAAASEVVARMEARGEDADFFNLFNHRSRYYDVLTIPRLAEATARKLIDGRTDRPELVRETAALLAEEARRRWINRFHDYGESPPAPAGDRSARADGAPGSPARPLAAVN